jgi:hypothetical protein
MSWPLGPPFRQLSRIRPSRRNVLGVQITINLGNGVGDAAHKKNHHELYGIVVVIRQQVCFVFYCRVVGFSNV